VNDSKPNSFQARGAMNNAGWNAFGTLFNIAITFLLAPVLIHYLGTDQWGLLLLVWSVTGVLGMANFGVGEATLRFIAHYLAEKDMAGVNRVLGATLTFYISVCLVVSAGLFAATHIVVQWVKVPTESQYPVESLLRLSALLFSLGMLSNAYRSIPMAMHRYDISSRIGLGQSVLRSAGILVLIVVGAGVVHVVWWEVVLTLAYLGYQIRVARKLLPDLRWLPSMSFTGLREIFGYSVFTFLTHVFLTIYREVGKLVLGHKVGPTSVAYLGTPDSVAYRLHMIVVSGVETLMPRFSASRDPEKTRALLVTATWSAVFCGMVLYLPLAVLMPDFLRLWINPEFARASAATGQLLAISFVAPAAFAPIATLFRGIGRPAFVTAVMVAAGAAVLLSTLWLVSSHGPAGVGYGYVFSGVAWLGGLIIGWLQLYGLRSAGLLVRVAGLPIILGAGLGLAQAAFRHWWGELGWMGLFLLGAAFAGVNAVSLLGADCALGGDSPARQVLERVLQSERVLSLRRRFGLA
jgi:O-antigen/teichoic acid export membrane protein